MANHLSLGSVSTFLFALCSTVQLSSGQYQASASGRTCLQQCDSNRRWLCSVLCGRSGFNGCVPSCRFTRDVDNYFRRCQNSCARTIFTPAPTRVPPRQSCGVATVGRIVGGTEARECEFPWAVVVKVGSLFCGGSIIDSNTVLTAGHCVYSSSRGLAQASTMVIKYGSSDQNRAKTAYVIRVQTHPKFILQYFDYDVALLTLDRKLTYSACVQPICLPKVNADPFQTQGCVAAGWGAVKFTQPTAQQILRKVSLPIVPLSQCQAAYNTRLVSNIKICAGNLRQGGVDSCLGDSGGPLMCYTNGAYYIYGIVSFGRACAHAGSPGVYSRVPQYQINNWIRQNM